MGSGTPLNEEALGDLLKKVASEIARMTELCLDIQFAIAGVTVDVDDSKLGFVRDLQGVDRLTQELEGLSGFLSTLEQSIPEDWCIDPERAFAEVKMYSQASRLRGQDQTPTDDGDDLELFDVG